MKYKYIVCCTLTNNFLPYFAYSFSEAIRFAETISGGDCVKRVEIHKISTGATIRYIF